MQSALVRICSIMGRNSATAAAWLCFIAVQLVWLHPLSSFSRLAAAQLSFISKELAGSYVSYFLLWFCTLVQTLFVLRMVRHTEVREIAHVLLAFPVLLAWDALFSLYPGYPVERVNLLLLSCNSPVLCFILMKHMQMGWLAHAVSIAIVGLETV